MTKQFSKSMGAGLDRRAAWLGGGLAVLAGAGLVVSCGGGGGSDPTPPAGTGQAATLDTAGATTAAANMATLIKVCQTTAGGLSADDSPVLTQALAAWSRQRQVRQGLAPTMRAQALGSTQPADVLGGCGGRYGYTSYSHVSGVTTATLNFDNYCTGDTASGTQVVHGSVSFVNTATPTASGPITSQWVGSSSGLRIKSTKAGGTVATDESLSFSNLGYTVGVPGGTPTADKPDVLQAAEWKMVDNLTGKSYLQTNYRISSYDTASGGSQVTFSGRGYRASGDYYDISTTAPVTTDASGKYTGGVLVFSGANSSQAVVTIVPGSSLQATMTVNGSPVTGLPACAK